MSRVWTTGLVIAVVAVAASVSSAALIGSWPVGEMWENQPVAGYAAGSTSVSGGLLLQPAPTTAAKTGWMNNGATEKLALAQLQLAPVELVTSVHAKIYDPGLTGKGGWTVILKDTDGKVLDFGARGVFAPGQIIARQFDGAAWTNGPSSSRGRTGNNYYTMDFSQNADGTVKYTIDAYENGATWNYTNSTTVAYGRLSEVYLSTNTTDTTAVNFKWTEFTYAPEPGTLALLGMGGLLVRRRKA